MKPQEDPRGDRQRNAAGRRVAGRRAHDKLRENSRAVDSAGAHRPSPSEPSDTPEPRGKPSAANSADEPVSEMSTGELRQIRAQLRMQQYAEASPAPPSNVRPIAMGAAGVVATVVSFSGLPWAHFGPGRLNFSDIRTLTSGVGSPAYLHTYFGWLAWLLLIVASVLAVASGARTRWIDELEIAAVLVALAGVIATGFAMSRLSSDADPSAGHVSFSAGPFVCLAGFIALGVSVVLPRTYPAIPENGSRSSR